MEFLGNKVITQKHSRKFHKTHGKSLAAKPSLNKARRQVLHLASKLFHINFSIEDLEKTASVLNISNL